MFSRLILIIALVFSSLLFLNDACAATGCPQALRDKAEGKGLLNRPDKAAEIECRRLDAEKYALETRANLNNVWDDFEKVFREPAEQFADRVMPYAYYLFEVLATIALAWTAIEMALRRAEIGEIFAELSKFIIFTGLFFAFLKYGTTWAQEIVNNLTSIADSGMGVSNSSASGSKNPLLVISYGVKFGYTVFDTVRANNDSWGLRSLLISMSALSVAFIMLIVFILIGIKMVVLHLTLLLQMYAGCFFLGFGGCKWTRDTSINYFRSVLANAAAYFVLIFIVGMITQGCEQIVLKELEFLKDPLGELPNIVVIMSLCVVPLILLFLSFQLPSAIAHLIHSNFTSLPTASGMISAPVRATQTMAGYAKPATAVASAVGAVAGGGLGLAVNATRMLGNAVGGTANLASSAAGRFMGSVAARRNAANAANLATGALSGCRADPSSMLIRARELYNNGDCSKHDETAAKTIASTLAESRTAPKEVQSEASDLAKRINSNEHINDVSRLAHGTDMTDMSAAEQGELRNTVTAATDAVQRDTDAGSMLNTATEMYQSGNCSKADESRALMTADAIAESNFVDPVTKVAAQDLGRQIRSEQGANAERRNQNGTDQSELSPTERQQMADSLSRAAQDWNGTANTPQAMLSRARQTFAGGNCSKADETRALMMAESLADNPNVPAYVADSAHELRNQIRDEMGANDARRAESGNAQDSADLGFHEQNQFGNELQTSARNWETQQNNATAGEFIDPEVRQRAENNAGFFRNFGGALADITVRPMSAAMAQGAGKALDWANNHQPVHMVDSFRASHERQYEQTDQRLNGNQNNN